MPSLEDPGPMGIFAKALVRMHERWDFTTPVERRTAFLTQAWGLCGFLGIPLTTVTWTAGLSAFDRGTWTLSCRHAAYLGAPAGAWQHRKGPYRTWLGEATAFYHEMRHVEQFWLTMQAVLGGHLDLPIPEPFAGSERGLLAFVVQQMGCNDHAARMAAKTSAYFDRRRIPLVEACIESLYGAGQPYRNAVLARMAADPEDMVAYGAYRGLLEEEDAYAVQHRLSRMVRDLIGRRAGQAALADVRHLFE